MKKLIYPMLTALFFIIVCACAMTTPKPGNEIINPGDRVGKFIITTGDSENAIFITKLHCPFDSRTSTESCEQPVGTMVNVGLGIYNDHPFKGKTLDEYWTEHTCEMYIEGRPVNLHAFGSIDISYPVVGTERVWNVVIVTDNPGTITAHLKGVVRGTPFDHIAILTFTVP